MASPSHCTLSAWHTTSQEQYKLHPHPEEGGGGTPHLWRKCKWHPHITWHDGSDIPIYFQKMGPASPFLFRSLRCHLHLIQESVGGNPISPDEVDVASPSLTGGADIHLFLRGCNVHPLLYFPIWLHTHRPLFICLSILLVIPIHLAIYHGCLMGASYPSIYLSMLGANGNELHKYPFVYPGVVRKTF